MPLVILSHGMYGHRFNQLWLARRLAQAGFVAAAVDHPGTTTFNRDRTLSRRLWERPLDIGRVIDALMADSATVRLIDPREQTGKLVDADGEGPPIDLPLVAFYDTDRVVFDSPQRRRGFKKEFPRFAALEGALSARTNFRTLFQ